MNVAISYEIQKLLNAMTRGEKVEMPTSSLRPVSFRECGENIFTDVTAASAFTTDAATTDWYAGLSDYNFAEHKPKSDAVAANSDQFT